VRSRNQCCHRNAIMSSHFMVADLHIAVKNIKPYSVDMETQKLVSFAMLSTYTTFCTAVTTNVFGSACKVPGFCPISTKTRVYQDFSKRPPHQTSRKSADKCRQRDRQTDMTKLTGRSFSLFIRPPLKTEHLSHPLQSKQLWVYHWTVL